MSDYPINGKSFSDDLKYWRAERPDEWVMDRFIREAKHLEAETARLQEIERNVDLVTQQWQQRVQELEALQLTMDEACSNWIDKAYDFEAERDKLQARVDELEKDLSGAEAAADSLYLDNMALTDEANSDERR